MGRLTLVWALATSAAVFAGCRERAQAVQGEAELRDMVKRMMPVVARADGMPFKREQVVLRRSLAQGREDEIL